ncbi:hypothetical protein AHAS_Ahas11G0186200 [Arachis hypogaea]
MERIRCARSLREARSQTALKTHTPLIRQHGPQTQHSQTNRAPHAKTRAGKRKHTGGPSQRRWAGFKGRDKRDSRDSPKREVLRTITEQLHRLDKATRTTHTPLIRHHGPQTQHTRTNRAPHA